MKIIFLLTFLLLTSSLFSQYCSDDKRFTEVDYFTIDQVKTVTNIVYGEALDYTGKKVTLYMDIYFPDTLVDKLELRPAIMMIHGGGFVSGNKEQRRTECITLAQRGYVAIAISYRLGFTKTSEYEQAYAIYRAHQDAHAALRFIVINKKNTISIPTGYSSEDQAQEQSLRTM